MKRRAEHVERRKDAPPARVSRRLAVDEARRDADGAEWLARHPDIEQELLAANDDFGSLSGERSDYLLDEDGEPLGSLSDAAAAHAWTHGDDGLGVVASGSVAAAVPKHGPAPCGDLGLFRRLLADWGTLHIPRRLPRALLLIVLVERTRGPDRLRPAREVAGFLNRPRPPIPAQPEIGFDGEPNPGPIARVSVRQVQRLFHVLRALAEDPPLDPKTRWRHYVEAMELKGVTIEGPFRIPGTADPNAPPDPPILVATSDDGKETRWNSIMGADGRWQPTTPAEPCPRCGAPISRPSPFAPKPGPAAAHCSKRCTDAARKARSRATVSR